jgi:hypothetical protein
MKSVGQAFPAYLGSVTTDRVRDWEPVAQETEHADQLEYMLILQSIGQAKVLQAASAERAAHTAPPCWAAVMTDLDFVLDPLPQVLEQAPYLDQPESLQSIGQA